MHYEISRYRPNSLDQSLNSDRQDTARWYPANRCAAARWLRGPGR